MANHRADRRSAPRRRTVDPVGASGSGSPAGRHRLTSLDLPPAPRHGILSGPTLAGAAVVLVAGAGALSVSSAQGAPSRLEGTHLATHVHPGASLGALSGTDSVVSSAALDRRERAVSRDSQRQAQAAAADEDLQAEAEEQAKERNAALAKLAASAEKQAGLIAKDAWQLPVTPGVYHLTSRFGECSSLWSHCHTGLDFAAPEGTPIHAIANGTVTETAYSGAYGNRTIVTLPDGTELWYCHQSAFGVQKGQQVTAGQEIGRIGSTGNVTGPHVHVEVRPGAGDPVDPFAALVAHGLKP